MSNISEEEKAHQIKTSFEVDSIYLQALEQTEGRTDRTGD